MSLFIELTFNILGCEVDTFGVDCMPCIGCQYCDISSGVCDACKSLNQQGKELLKKASIYFTSLKINL